MYKYIKSSREDVDFYGQKFFNKYHELVKNNLSGMIISKRIDEANEPGGIEYEANKLGIDLYDLIECLEGMCHEGEAVELSDYQYRIL